MITKIQFWLIVCLFTGAVSACTSAAEQSAPSEYPSPAETGEEYPPPVNAYPEMIDVPTIVPYPSDSSAPLVATPGSIPTPGNETGVITGKFLGDDKPVVDVILYLAEVKKDEEGREMLAAYSIFNSPTAYTDRNGRFVYSNVLPGKYGLVWDTVVSSFCCTIRMLQRI